MLGNVWLFALSSSILYNSKFVTGSCNLAKDCELHSWLPWQSCVGNCGSQTQLRQREFCCPRYVIPKTIDNCFAACSLPVVELNEYKPCHLCYNNTLSSNNTCTCNYGYKWPCCKGLSFIIFLNQIYNFNKELQKLVLN